MENVVLTVHLILAVCLCAVVLMQRSEGGGLGIGGGGGGAVSGRSAATALSKLTWLIATGFLITSLTLTVLAARDTRNDSVIERLGADAVDGNDGAIPLPPALEGDLLPPSPTDGPATPPKAE